MNIGVMKIGARIHENDKIGNSTNEVLATIKLLQGGGANVTAFTQVLPSDNKNTSFPIKNYEDFYGSCQDLDALVIVNGNLNFYGGQKDQSVEVYKCVNHFTGPVFYFMYDPYLGLKQCVKSVINRDWNTYTEKELFIPNKLHYITQCRATNLIHEEAQQTCTYYPLEKFPLFMEPTFEQVDFDKAEYDLNYAGTFRGGRREKDMVKFFFGLPDDIRAQMFGNLNLSQFKKNGNLRPPEFGKSVTHDLVKENIQKGLSTVIIGDKKYKELDDIAQRASESIIYGQVTFIDSDYDRKNRMYDKELSEFLRIDDREQLVDRLRKIKNDKNLFYEILEKQKNHVLKDFNKDEYAKDLIRQLESLM